MAEASVVFGLHAVRAVLTRRANAVTQLTMQRGRDDERSREILELARAQGLRVEMKSVQDLDALSGGERHQGVVARVKPSETLGEGALDDILDNVTGSPCVLVLDGVQDPHNLGACLRTADAAGVHAVVAPRDRAAGLSSVVRKVAAGAAETVPFIQVTNLARSLRGFKDRNMWVVGADGEAELTVFAADLNGPVAMVLGAEGIGLRRLTREHCDVLVKIPMQGAVESLNVSVAAGVMLFEALRQRTLKSK